VLGLIERVEQTLKMIRWSKQEIYDMRMFVLACYELYDTFAWKDVALFLRNRNSTQVRTHIQKFRDKLKKDSERIRKLVEEISTETRQDSRNTKDRSKSHSVSDKDKVFIEKLVKDYFEIVKSAVKNGVRFTDEQGDHTYLSLLKQYSKIPDWIFSLQDNPIGEAYVKVKLNEILSDKSETLTLLTHLQTTVETETSYSIIDYDRANTSTPRPNSNPKSKPKTSFKRRKKRCPKPPISQSSSSISSAKVHLSPVAGSHCELYCDSFTKLGLSFLPSSMLLRDENGIGRVKEERKRDNKAKKKENEIELEVSRGKQS
jgi:hypothetical protein